MQGFDQQFNDFPDYVLKVSKAVWEDRGIAALRRYYAPDIIVRTPLGHTLGNQRVIAAALGTLAEFPDRQLLGEDVIWCGGADSGLMASHRLLCTATHSGDGAHGAATGTRLRYRVIADCHARANVIDDEWLISDHGAIVRQLGQEPRDYARAQIAREGGPGHCQRPWSPDTDPLGPYRGGGDDNEWGERYANLLKRIMHTDFAVIPSAWDRACQIEWPGGRSGYSHGEVDRCWMGLRAAFPNAQFRVEHRVGREDPLMPPRAALRWTLQGCHEGWGAFGPPTGAEVVVMGASHAEFGPRGLRREYVVFDEVAIWKQILLATGAC